MPLSHHPQIAILQHALYVKVTHMHMSEPFTFWPDVRSQLSIQSSRDLRRRAPACLQYQGMKLQLPCMHCDPLMGVHAGWGA